MKRFLLTIAITFAFMAAYAADINPISNALKSGNASTLASAMDKEIDMNKRVDIWKYSGKQ